MALLTLPRQYIADINGAPRVGAFLYLYDAGTNNTRIAYTSSDLSIELAQPIRSLEGGIFPAVHINPDGDYKIVVQDKDGATIYTEDNLAPTLDSISSTLIATTLDSLKRTAAEIAAGVTPVNYAYPPGHAYRYGASPSASAAVNAAAFQKALNTGHHLYIPKLEPTEQFNIDTRLELTVSGQCVFGEGLRSKIVQMGTGANSTVFRALNLGRNEFHNVYAVPNTSTTALVDGYGFSLVSSNHCIVQNCRVTNHRRGGILLSSSNFCQVIDNLIFDSVVDPVAGDTQSDTGADIYLSGSCSRNIIRGNHCINGAGVGIAIQTLNGGDVADHNTVEGNIIDSQDLYGVMLYLFNLTDTCNHNIVRGNQISNISGDVPQDDMQYIYGAGVYVQTADHTIIEGNLIRNTNVHASPSLQNVPAAIAISGCAHAIVTGNMIIDANYWGIACIQATAYTAGGRGLIIANNSLHDIDQTGIYLLDCVGALIEGNRLDGVSAGAQGIYIRQATTAQCDDFTVRGNRIEDFGTGIQFEGTINRAVVSENIIRGNTGSAIALNAATTICHGNIVANGTGGDGISIGAACANGFCVRNFVSGGDNGILDDAGGTLRVDDNEVSGATASITNLCRALANSATPSVKNARWVSNANTTTITNLTNGYNGQVVTINGLASFTVQTGGSIQLNGGVNFSMTSGDMLTLLNNNGTWQELARSVN